jgi:hypothetical protein
MEHGLCINMAAVTTCNNELNVYTANGCTPLPKWKFPRKLHVEAMPDSGEVTPCLDRRGKSTHLVRSVAGECLTKANLTLYRDGEMSPEDREWTIAIHRILVR